MAGHSKWANIKHKKAHDRREARQDLHAPDQGNHRRGAARRRRRVGEPAAAPRDRQGDATRTCRRTRSSSAIKRGAGQLDGANYEEIRYEGYGINGAAVIVDCMTDNRTRTVADVRHAFSKYGGNLGTDGSVAFLFKHCGQIVFAPGTSEDKVMEAAIDAGAEDVVTHDDGSVEVVTGPVRLRRGQGRAREGGPQARVRRGHDEAAQPRSRCRGDDAQRMQKLLDALESLDDVQEVYTSAVLMETA